MARRPRARRKRPRLLHQPRQMPCRPRRPLLPPPSPDGERDGKGPAPESTDEKRGSGPLRGPCQIGKAKTGRPWAYLLREEISRTALAIA